MKAWLGRLSLRYKLTLSALAVEAVMLSLLIVHGVQLTTQTLQSQAERRMQEIARTLEAALLAPLAQQDDASVRDLIETLLQTDGLKMIAVRDSNKQIIHQTGVSGDAHDFHRLHPVEVAGQHYGEVALVLSGSFIQDARNRYLRNSLVVATVALLLTGVLLALSTGGVVRRFVALTRASKRMEQGDLDVKLAGEGEDEIGQLIGTFNRMAESVRFNVERARENEARFHAIADYTHDIEFWMSPEGRLLWVNPSVERLIGYTVGECMGKMNFPPTSSIRTTAPQPSSSYARRCAAPPARAMRCGCAARTAGISGRP
jgi:PAS domain-containing protein